MNPRRRIEKLEIQHRLRPTDVFDPGGILAFQAAGIGKRSDAQKEMIRRLNLVMSDSRATPALRVQCEEAIANIDLSLQHQLRMEERVSTQ